jgi:autotransporter-associated beta strand protein
MVLTNNTSLHLKLGIDLNGKTLHVSGAGKLLMQDSLVMNGGTLVLSGQAPLTFTNNSTGAVLDGTLQFLPEGTFAPTNGASFDLLDNPGVLGAKKFTTVSLPTLVTGLKWNTNALYTAGNVSIEAVQQSLTVVTLYGNANPPSGTNTYNYGTNLTAALTNSPVLNGTTTQYVCRGWSGTGSVLASGTSTNTGSFTLTTNSTLVWLWTTNYWLDTATNGNGSVNVSDGWKTNGTSVQITATPGADWLFTAWSGSTNGCTITGNIITAPMTAARTITANFEIDPLSLPNTWQVNVSGTWTNPVNWTDGIVPGISGGSNSADVVIFSATLTTNRVVTVDTNRNLGGILFGNTSTNAYVLTNGSIRLSNGGVIQTLAGTGNHNDIIASAITIMGNGGSATIRNDAEGNTAGLLINGTISGNSTTGSVTTLYLDGASVAVSSTGGRNNVTSGLSDGTGGGRLKVVKNGTGIWSLSFNATASTFTGGLDFNSGTIRYYGNSVGGFGRGIITIGTNVTFYHGNSLPLSVITNALAVTGDFTLNGGPNVEFRGPINLGSAVRMITQNAGTNTVFSGVISNGGLIKAGADPLTLSGNNTYSGGTIISNGALICTANNSLGASNVIVLGGATLTLGATNCINNAATLTLATNSTLNLNFTGADTVGGISRDSGATWLPSGTYNATALGATGTGSLTITSSSFLLIIK